MRFDDLFADLDWVSSTGCFGAVPDRDTGPIFDDVVPLSTIDSGGERSVAVARETPCLHCGGTGAAAGTQPRACKKCGGSGRLTKQRKRGNVSIQHISTCPECRGAGSFIDKPCARCAGTGFGHDEETLTVRIPAGAEQGMVRVPGRGARTAETGGQPGATST